MQTPDLRGRFIVGFINQDDQGHSADPAYAYGYNNAISPDYRSISANGGSAMVVLDSTQIAPHMHEMIDFGHSHSITGQVMQKEGSSTKSVTAIDIGNDTWNGIKTFSNKIGSGTTNVYMRKSGGVYTYTPINNPPQYIVGCTVWRYTCNTTSSSSFQSSVSLSVNTDYGSGDEKDLSGTDESGYAICVPSAIGYCGIGTSKTYVSSSFRVTSCTENSNWDNSYPNNCVSDNWDPRVSEGTPIRLNEKWQTAGHENRPPYYVLAFIMRIR
jgi:hypothetical protein